MGSADLKNSGVQSADLADGGIQLGDLSAPLQAKVNQVVEGLINTGQLANGAVTNPKLASNSVSSSKVAANSLGSGDLAGSSVGSSEIAANGVGSSELAANTVDSDEIVNGSLNAADVGQFSGSVGRNFGAIPSGDMRVRVHRSHPRPGNIGNRVAVVTPGPGFSGNVSFHAEAEGPQLRLKACNPTADRHRSRRGGHELQLHRVRLIALSEARLAFCEPGLAWVAQPSGQEK